MSAELSWVPCFENFTCANLEVPLDYENLEAGTTNIAFMRLLAPEQPAKGDIILNAGGPGNSAATAPFVASAAAFLNTTSYNVVGMDIRAVNNSGPSLNCFPDAYSRDIFVMDKWFATINPTDEASRHNYWALTGGFVDMCYNKMNESAKYINSAAVAADMVYYTEKVAESEGRDPSQELVNFYGLSYGTYLGAAFAKLYPDRVGRFIIDGVGDYEDYFSGSWAIDIKQADESLSAFFTYCFEAGSKCPFFKDDASADVMHERFDAILAELNENPIVVTDENIVEFPYLFNANELLGNILYDLYNLQQGFPKMARGLSAIEKDRNATEYAHAQRAPRESTYVPDHSTIYSRQFYVCNDMNQRFNISSPEELDKNVEKVTGYSKYFGGLWGNWFTVSCWNWETTPPEHQVLPAGSGTCNRLQSI
jgi:pimeloyl-ACP methyl ester carboxylesterase